MAADEVITLVVQVNGRVRARLQMPAEATEEQARTAALGNSNVRRHIQGRQLLKIIYVPGRLVNLVVR